jgi:chaperonin cofactor prefoldin
MAKINFTKEHFDRMCVGILEMVLKNTTVSTKMGTPLNALELLHTTTIGTLNGIRLSLSKQIETLENQDEWVAESTSQTKLESLKSTKETVNLIIGYKRYQLEKEETANKRRELEAKLSQLKESQKTPEDKIKELEDALSELDSTTF